MNLFSFYNCRKSHLCLHQKKTCIDSILSFHPKTQTPTYAAVIGVFTRDALLPVASIGDCYVTSQITAACVGDYLKPYTDHIGTIAGSTYTSLLEVKISS